MWKLKLKTYLAILGMIIAVPISLAISFVLILVLCIQVPIVLFISKLLDAIEQIKKKGNLSVLDRFFSIKKVHPLRGTFVGKKGST